MIRRKGRFGEFLGCTGYSIKNEKGEPSCNVIIALDKAGNPEPPKVKIPTTIACEKCGNNMVLRSGAKRGPWLGCATYPKCKATKTIGKLTGADLKQAEALLPLLNEESAKSKEMVSKIIGDNPTMAAAADAKPKLAAVDTGVMCEDCGKPMKLRDSRRGYFLGCSGYPKCKGTAEVPSNLIDELGLNKKTDDKPAVVLPPEEDNIATDIAID